MFVLDRRAASAELRHESELAGIIRKLEAEGYAPMIRKAVCSIRDSAGVNLEDTVVRGLFSSGPGGFNRFADAPEGDLLFTDRHVFLLQPLGSELHAWELRHHLEEAAIVEFCNLVTKYARATLDGRRLRGMSFDWRPVDIPPRRLPRSRLQQKITPLRTQRVDYTEEDLARSEALVAPDQRQFLVRLAQLGKARSADARAVSDATRTAVLLENSLISKEYLVLCKQDSHTICSVPNRDELAGEHGSKFRCSLCGRSLQEEQVQEIFAVTDSGRAILAGSRWMTVWVTDLLMKCGVEEKAVVWNAVAGEDEVDIIVTLLGQRVFFELKDREFGLGDAYPFAFRVQRYGADFGVVITTEQVGDEARRFLDEQPRQGGVSVRMIEGQENVQAKLSSVLDDLSRVAANRILADMSEAMGFPYGKVLDAWMRTRSAAPANT